MWKQGGGEERTYRLPSNHGWKASRPGSSVLVINRGAAVFEAPSKWITTPIEGGALRISDRKPPKERMRIDVTVVTIPPPVREGVTVDVVLEDFAYQSPGRDLTSAGAIEMPNHPDYEIAWMPVEFIDPDENRKAHGRLCLARKGNLFVYITSDFYPEVSKPAIRAWNTMLATLKVGEKYDDPTMRSRMN